MYSILIFLAIVGALVYFKWPTIETDIDKLVEGITGTITKLEDAAEVHTKASDVHAAQASESAYLAQVAEDKATRASKIAEKLQGLIT